MSPTQGYTNKWWSQDLSLKLDSGAHYISHQTSLPLSFTKS